MGTIWSVSVRDYYHPLEAPRTDRPPTFDPLYGFPNGRKVREMKATWEEMDEQRLTPGERDYCAHLLIDFKKCQVCFYWVFSGCFFGIGVMRSFENPAELFYLKNALFISFLRIPIKSMTK